jgi:hypothetical protein
LPPFESFAVAFDYFDYADVFQAVQVVGERRGRDAGVVVVEFLLRRSAFRMADDRSDDVRAGRIL